MADFFVIHSLACPMGWYGPNCQQLCACEHSCPCNPQTGSCNITYELAIQDQLNRGTAQYSGFFLVFGFVVVVVVFLSIWKSNFGT